MVVLPLHRIVFAASENLAKQLGITKILKKAIGRSETGGVRWNERAINDNLKHILAVSDIVQRHVRVQGKVGVEIGPGDNLGTAFHLLTIGAKRMYGVEKFGSISDAWNRQLFAALDSTADVDVRLRHAQLRFEDFCPDEPIDFIYSHDVLEHVDLAGVFNHSFEILRPGGDFVHAVDFTGHNCFHDPHRPLDFLTCPDWLWRVLFSAMETTNRVRYSQLVHLALNTGFELVRAHVVRRAKPEYLGEIRPHLLPRFAQLGDDDLSVMQCELHFRKQSDESGTSIDSSCERITR